MSDRHLHDLDRATALAVRALATRPDASCDALTRMLRQRWWLGLGLPGAVLAAQRRAADRHRGPCEPWRTWGEHWDPVAHPAEPLLRIYLACAPGTGLQTVATVTDRARAWSEPWLLSSRALHQPVPTADATVLTVPVASLAPLRKHLARLVADLRPFLASQAPLLTLHVTRGVGIAECPGGDASYGEHRCRLVATAVLEHREEPLRELQRRTQAAFWSVGVDPRRPYRSVDAAWQWHRERVAA
jgi:hypothetical protein